MYCVPNVMTHLTDEDMLYYCTVDDTVSFEMHVYVCCRYQMQDWDGKLLAEANAKKHMLPSFFPITYHYPIPRDWDNVSKVSRSVVLIPEM